jgi:hypothetical protein
MQAFAWNCRNQSLRCEGRSTSGQNREARVPMRSTGADSSVVAVRWGNAHGAKGGGHPRQNRQANGKTGGAAGPDGRRQPSVGGTSRICREAYVRFCERLGVKFPGPTRQVGTRCVIVGDIIRQQVAKAPFAQHDDMVQAFASNRSDQTFDMTRESGPHRVPRSFGQRGLW